MMKRRDLIRYCMASGLSFPWLGAWAKLPSNGQKTVLLVELQGGNDGLNTVIPFADPLYYEYRPNLGLKENEIIKLNDQLAFHHSLEAFMPIWEKQQLSVTLGVGYENPILSHFRSIEIWDTASKSDEYLSQGWMAKQFTSHSRSTGQHTVDGLVLGGTYGPLQGAEKVLQINDINRFLKRSDHLEKLNVNPHLTNNFALNKLLRTQSIIDTAAEGIKAKLKPLHAPQAFAKNVFAQQMALATQVIQSELNIPVIKVKLGGFDTHANQKPKHARLLKMLSEAVFAMQTALRATGHWQATSIMTYSEFGRRVKENGSKGTDHGTAAPHFIIGGNVKGGFLGTQPKLNDLENGNLKHAFSMEKYVNSVILT